MNEFSNRELYQALAYAKSVDEQTGKRIMGQFEGDYLGLYQTLFGLFAAIIE